VPLHQPLPARPPSLASHQPPSQVAASCQPAAATALPARLLPSSPSWPLNPHVNRNGEQATSNWYLEPRRKQLHGGHSRRH
jgi:hypothetical protein